MLLLNNEKIDLGKFPDGTLHMQLFADYLYGDFDIVWHYENDAELFALICIVKSLRSRFACSRNIRLYLPYIPHARMDRVKENSDVFTLKCFADVINSLNFERVYVYDPHSSVSTALIDRVCISSHEWIISHVMRKIAYSTTDPDILLFYPDEGAMKRYAKMIKAPYCFGIKNRDWNTGKILGLSVVGDPEDIADSNILIVDDICSRGGTFLHSAKKLKELGAKDIYLYVTHCENTVLEGKLLEGDLIKHLYTTNSIFTASHPKIEVINLV